MQEVANGLLDYAERPVRHYDKETGRAWGTSNSIKYSLAVHTLLQMYPDADLEEIFKNYRDYREKQLQERYTERVKKTDYEKTEIYDID